MNYSMKAFLSFMIFMFSTQFVFDALFASSRLSVIVYSASTYSAAALADLVIVAWAFNLMFASKDKQ